MDSPRPTLAVVISAYNYDRFIATALDSVLAQQPSFDEIIVVNDGSTDNTAQVLAEYEGQATIIHGENRGQIGACLEGMRTATTDYVYLLDADDFAAPGMVAAVRPLLATWPAKVQFQLEGVDIDGARIDSVFPKFPEDYTAEDMRDDNRMLGFYQCPPTSGNVLHREKLLACNLDPQAKPPHIDAVGVLIQPYLGEVITLPEQLAFYRVHGSNMFNTGWSNPSIAQLEKELQDFNSSWTEAVRVLELEDRPFGDNDPAFVLERKLMIAALEGRWWVVGEVLRFVCRMWATRLPARSKLLLSVWAMGFVMPLAGWRRRLITQRRNPEARSRWVRNLVRRQPRSSTTST